MTASAHPRRPRGPRPGGLRARSPRERDGLRGFPLAPARAGLLDWLCLGRPGAGQRPTRRRLGATDLNAARRAGGLASARGRRARRERRRAAERLELLERLRAGDERLLGAGALLSECGAAPRARRLAARWSRLPRWRLFARALAWTWAPRPAELRAAFALASAHEAALSPLVERIDLAAPDLVPALWLVDLLHQHGARRLAPLLALLESLRGPLPLGAGRGVVARLRQEAVALAGRARRPRSRRQRQRDQDQARAQLELPRSDDPRELLARHLRELGALTPRAARCQLQAWTRLAPEFQLEGRRRWWSQVRLLARRVRRLIATEGRQPASLQQIAALISAIGARRDDAPEGSPLPELLLTLRRLSAQPRLWARLRRLVPLLPPGERLPACERWLARARAHPQAPLLSVLEGWTRGLRQRSPQQRACLLRLSRRRDLGELSELGGPAGDATHPRRAVAALFAFADAAPQGRPLGLHWRPFLALLREAEAAGRPAASVGALLGELELAQQGALSDLAARSQDAIELAVRCAAGAGARLVALAARLASLDLDDDDEERLARAARDWPGLVGDQLLAGEPPAPLLEVADLQLALRRLGQDPASEPARTQAPLAPTGWIRAYPCGLRDLLRALACADRRAEQSAARALGREFPRPEALRREIVALQARIAREGDRAGRLQRLVALRARLGAPPTRAKLAPAKLRRCRRRLADRLRRARVRHLRDRLLARLTRALRAEVPGLPDEWLAEPATRRALVALAGLEERTDRELGLRLLRERLGPRPWDLRDAPPNARWLARLERLGLDPRPWLEGFGTWVRAARDGRVVLLSLEDDPLEVLQMGAPFATCLAPGDFNFFSALSNAVDLNKRVLYARDPRGRVLGRCLLALSPRGELLAYRPYARDGGLGMDELAAGVVRELARRMRTHPSGRGCPERLVAPNWYDDGVVDVCEVERFFSDPQEPRRARLEAVEVGALLPLLDEALRPRPLDARLAARTLELPELTRRPELAIPLLAFAERFPPRACVRAARLARAAGRPQLATGALRRALRASRRLDPLLGLDLARELAARGQAGLALRTLERTRPAPERRDPFERLALRAELSSALRRPAQARAAWRAAQACAADAPQRARCARGLAQLAPAGVADPQAWARARPTRLGERLDTA